MQSLSFTIPEILSLIGLVQCVYLFVHIFFLRGKMLGTVVPSLYFFVLGAAFFFDFAQKELGSFDGYYLLQWASWFYGPPLSVLLVIQFADINKRLLLRDYWVVLLVPICYVLSVLAMKNQPGCGFFDYCEELEPILTITGYMAGAISLLVIFSKKNLFKNIKRQRNGTERYWLIFSLIFMNIFFLTGMMAEITETITVEQSILFRTILGLGFAYIVSTSLLRLYPQTVFAQGKNTGANIEDFSDEDRLVAKKVEDLMTLDKVYQEPTYSRADLARECNVAETVISRIINVYFQKSFPQLLNELRVDDAKTLLKDTDAPVNVICEEVGFNSLPSFNRVFKDITGHSPSVYRKHAKG